MNSSEFFRTIKSVKASERVNEAVTCWKCMDDSVIDPKRLSFNHYVGPCEPAADIENVCENSWCCNPHHLKVEGFELLSETVKIKRKRVKTTRKITDKQAENIYIEYHVNRSSIQSLDGRYGLSDTKIYQLVKREGVYAEMLKHLDHIELKVKEFSGIDLKDEQVVEIFELSRQQLSYTEIAERFNINTHDVSNIRYKKGRYARILKDVADYVNTNKHVTDEKARAVYEMCGSDRTFAEIGSIFEIDGSTVSNIFNREGKYRMILKDVAVIERVKRSRV